MSGPPLHPTSVSSRGPVLAVAMGSHSEYCYSGGADARIHSWKIPDLNMDPYDGYGEDSSLPSFFSPTHLPPGASWFLSTQASRFENSGGNAKGSHSGEAWAQVIQHVTEGQMRRGRAG